MSEHKHMRNLHQRIVAVMSEMGAVGKGGKTSFGDKFAYHKIDDIDEKLRIALVANGVVVTVVEIFDKELSPVEGVDKYGNPRTTWSAECGVTIELVNADNPTDRMSIKGWGQGLDYSDKATGKAISYACKAAYLSAFHLRGQPDNEEADIRKPAGTDLPAKQDSSKPEYAPVEKTQPEPTAKVEKPSKPEPPRSSQLSVQAHLWVNDINQAATEAALKELGRDLREKPAEVQDEVRPYYAKRLKEIRSSDVQGKGEI